jgi:endo-1,4-beta-D-glucanase Y
MRSPSIRTRVNLRRCLTAAALSFAMLNDMACRATPTWPLWESYAAKFVDGQGRVVDHSAQDRTTTEGEAYAMFFALVANDRSRFDKLVDWTEGNLAQGDLTLHLPAWSWGRADDGSWRVLDPHPAADADLWMAYALEEAGRMWDVDRYSKLGALMAQRVAHQEVVLVPGVGTTMIPGAEGFHPDPTTWYVNPSYLPPSLLEYFAKSDPQSPWQQVLASLPDVVAAQSGYAMDWMKVGADGIHPSAPPAAVQDAETHGKPTGVAIGSYDAIRVYLWLGLADPKTPGVRRAMDGVGGMAAYMNAHPTPPAQVDASGKILSEDAPPGFSAAVLPYLHAMGLKQQEAAQATRLAATRDVKTGLYGREGNYYDQNLALFATGWSEQRFRFEADGKLKVKWK